MARRRRLRRRSRLNSATRKHRWTRQRRWTRPNSILNVERSGPRSSEGGTIDAVSKSFARADAARAS
eukprot:272111-Pyramimonas_sp.AAC.1